MLNYSFFLISSFFLNSFSLNKLFNSRIVSFTYVRVPLLISLLVFSSCSSSSEDSTVFEIEFENVSSQPFRASNGTSITTAFSSMIGLIHEGDEVLYKENATDFNEGLSDLAQNGDAAKIAQSLQLKEQVEIVGIANQPSAGSQGILAPGQSYKLILSTSSNTSRLSLASSFIQGNDIVAMTRPSGIPLFNESGNPVSGNVTAFLDFYDVGTEFNEAPGIGPNQVIRQGNSPDNQTSAGIVETSVVKKVNDGFDYPTITNSIKVTLSVIQVGTAVPSPTPSASPVPSITPAVTPSSTPIASPSETSSPSSPSPTGSN